MNWPLELSGPAKLALASLIVLPMLAVAGVVVRSATDAGDEYPWHVASGQVLADGQRIAVEVDPPTDPNCQQFSSLETTLSEDGGHLAVALRYRTPPDVEFCAVPGCVGTQRLVLPLDGKAPAGIEVVPEDIPSRCR